MEYGSKGIPMVDQGCLSYAANDADRVHSRKRSNLRTSRSMRASWRRASWWGWTRRKRNQCEDVNDEALKAD